MKTAAASKVSKKSAYLAKVGTSGQFAIPKKVREALDLRAGDYVEVVIQSAGNFVVTPKTFIEKRLAEGLRDFKEGRTMGPFDNVDDLIDSLEAQWNYTTRIVSKNHTKMRPIEYARTLKNRVHIY